MAQVTDAKGTGTNDGEEVADAGKDLGDSEAAGDATQDDGPEITYDVSDSLDEVSDIADVSPILDGKTEVLDIAEVGPETAVEVKDAFAEVAPQDLLAELPGSTDTQPDVQVDAADSEVVGSLCPPTGPCDDCIPCTVDWVGVDGKCQHSLDYCPAGTAKPAATPSAAALGSLPPLPSQGSAELPNCSSPVAAITAGDGTVLAGGGLGCKTCCGPLPHATDWRCAHGACIVERCAAGWQDRNGNGADGCETPLAEACQLYVAATLTWAGADGSPQKPFPTLGQALAAAKPFCHVHLGTGVFSGVFKVDVQGLQISGEGPGKTVITRSPPTGGLQTCSSDLPCRILSLTGADTALSGLRFFGGSFGMHGKGAGTLVVRDVVVDNVHVVAGTSDIWQYIPEPAAAWPELAKATQIAVVGLRVLMQTHEDFVVKSYYVPSEFVQAIGLMIGTCQGGRIIGCDFQNLHASPQLVSAAAPFSEGTTWSFSGPAATGLVIYSSKGILAQNIRIDWLVPGDGFCGKDAKWYQLGICPAGVVIGLAVGSGAPGSATFDVQLGGEPVYFADGIDGYVAKGAVLSGNVAHSNLGNVFIANSKNAVVQGLSIQGGFDFGKIEYNSPSMYMEAPSIGPGQIWNRGIVLENVHAAKVIGNQVNKTGWKAIGLRALGSDGTFTGNAVQGSPWLAVDLSGCAGCPPIAFADGTIGPTAGIGLRMSDCTGCKITSTVVADVSGNKLSSFFSESYSGTDAAGGAATGIQALNSPSLQITDVLVKNVVAGQGWIVGYKNKEKCGPGGHASGIAVSGSLGVAVTRATVHHVQAGNGVAPFDPITNCDPGTAQGLSGFAGTSSINNVLVHSVLSGTISGGPAPGGTGIYASGDLTVNHLTCVLPDSAKPVDASGTLQLANSVIVGSAGATCFTKGDASYSLFWGCQAPAGSCKTATCKVAEPLFGSGDTYIPSCGPAKCSPLVDSGDPNSPYCLEPAPNGCQADIGYTGNTQLAVGKPGANTCGCP